MGLGLTHDSIDGELNQKKPCRKTRRGFSYLALRKNMPV